MRAALQRREIDDHKLIPLFLGVASYGLLILGVIKWGTHQSGYFGVEEGDYAYQHAEITLYWQALGLAIAIGAGLLTATALAWVLERTIGLTASEEAQVAGFDAADWDIVHDLEPYDTTATAAASAGGNGDGATAVGSGAGPGTSG